MVLTGSGAGAKPPSYLSAMRQGKSLSPLCHDSLGGVVWETARTANHPHATLEQLIVC